MTRTLTHDALDACALEAARTGDPDLVATVVASIEPLLHRELNAKLRRAPKLRACADDLMQEMRIVCLEQLPKYNGSTRVTTYLVACAKARLWQKLCRSYAPAPLRIPLYLWSERLRGPDDEAKVARLLRKAADIDVIANVVPGGDESRVREGEAAAATEAIRPLLATLPPRLRDILILRRGLCGGREHTLEEVGRRFGVSRERIRQLEKAALERLRAFAMPA